MASKQINEKSVTRFEPYEINYTWTLENFSLCNKKPRERLESQIFPKSCGDSLQWRLRLYPYGNNEQSKDYVSILLELVTQEEDGIIAQYKFNFQNANGSIIRSENYVSHHFKSNGGAKGCNLIKRDTLISLLKDDILVVNCCVKWQRNIINESIVSNNEKETVAKLDVQNDVLNDLHQLLTNSILSDVSLLAMDGAKFPAHKCVLAARSTVFAAMFEHNMKERRKSVVEINDVKANILKALLDFIYSGKFVKDECDIEELLAIADKYNVEKLKSLCEQELCQKLTVENAVNFLLLADRHNANMLKGQVLELITNNFKDVLKTQAMKNLSITQTSLFYNVLETVADKIRE